MESQPRPRILPRGGTDDFLRHTWWQHVLGHALAGPSLVGLAWNIGERSELISLFSAWAVSMVAMTAALWRASRPTRPSPRVTPVTQISVFLPKVILGSTLLIVPSGMGSREFLYVTATVLFATAAGTLITLGPILPLSVPAMLGLFVPMSLVLLYTGEWVAAVGILLFLAVLVAMGLRQVAGVYRELHDVRAEMADRAVRAEHLARTDELTGVLSRRGLAEVVAGPDRSGTGCIYVDLDDFKLINDRWGHGVGDRVLRHVALCLEESVRPADRVARIGGDEFVLLISSADRAVVEEVATRVLDRLSANPFVVNQDESFVISASLGLSVDPSEINDLDQLLDATDQALYRAKRSGSERLAWAEPRRSDPVAPPTGVEPAT